MQTLTWKEFQERDQWSTKRKTNMPMWYHTIIQQLTDSVEYRRIQPEVTRYPLKQEYQNPYSLNPFAKDTEQLYADTQSRDSAEPKRRRITNHKYTNEDQYRYENNLLNEKERHEYENKKKQNHLNLTPEPFKPNTKNNSRTTSRRILPRRARTPTKNES